MLVAQPRADVRHAQCRREEPYGTGGRGQPEQPYEIHARRVGVAILDPTAMASQIQHGRRRIADAGDVLEWIEDREVPGHATHGPPLVRRDLLGAGHNIVGRRDGECDEDRNEMNQGPWPEAPGSVTRRDRVQIDQRPEDPRHLVADAEEVRAVSYTHLSEP